MALVLHYLLQNREPAIMTLKIERFQARVRLSGELRSESLEQVEAEIDGCGISAILDVEEVDLIDLDGVRFLNRCELNGISVRNCSPYIREWMSREKGQLGVQGS
jgi:hypothetical protein